MDASSSWEQIGGACLLGGIGLAYYDGGVWAVVASTVGLGCMIRGMVVQRRRALKALQDYNNLVERQLEEMADGRGTYHPPEPSRTVYKRGGKIERK